MRDFMSGCGMDSIYFKLLLECAMCKYALSLLFMNGMTYIVYMQCTITCLLFIHSFIGISKLCPLSGGHHHDGSYV